VAGYSGDHRVMLIASPNGFSKTLGKLPTGAKMLKAGEGLVDKKVCAIDGTWSALKFEIRKKDRR